MRLIREMFTDINFFILLFWFALKRSINEKNGVCIMINFLFKETRGSSPENVLVSIDTQPDIDFCKYTSPSRILSTLDSTLIKT